MEQKKSIRVGKFNIIDIIAVILLVAVLAYGAFRLLSRGEAAVAGTVPITYVVQVENVAADLYDNCRAHLPARLMAKTGLLDGQIESVEKGPVLVIGPDGQWVEDPAHVNLYFTCTANVPDDMFTKVGEQEVRVGKTDYIMKSEYVEFQRTTILDVQWGE